MCPSSCSRAHCPSHRLRILCRIYFRTAGSAENGIGFLSAIGTDERARMMRVLGQVFPAQCCVGVVETIDNISQELQALRSVLREASLCEISTRFQ